MFARRLCAIAGGAISRRGIALSAATVAGVSALTYPHTPAASLAVELNEPDARKLMINLKHNLSGAKRPMPRFAFLLLKEHPYGREMLRQMLSEGFVPEMIIEEDSNIADEEREKFLTRIEGNDIAPPIAEQICGLGVKHVSVKVHNSKNVMPHIRDLPLDLIVLGGTRIIRGEMLDHPKHGVLNAHPGLLPACRGSASPAWSVYHEIPIGSTCHFCDRGIDTGNIIQKREVEVRRGMTYEDLCYCTLVTSGVLMKEALLTYIHGDWTRFRDVGYAQSKGDRPTFKNAPPEVVAAVKQKLKDQTYGHYVD